MIATSGDAGGLLAPPTVDPLLVPRVHRVIAVVDEIPSVVTLRVEPVDGDPIPFRPAQVSMVGAFGIGEAAISISSAVEQTDFHEYTIRRAGAITAALTSLGPGDPLWIRGPFGAPWDLDLDGCDVVVAAGGIGLAPLRAAVYELLRFRERYGEVVLVVGARDATHLLYEWQYDGWREHGITVVETIDQPERGWHRAVGFVSDVVAQVVEDRRLAGDRLRGLVCGPDIMMRLTAERLMAAGAPPAGVQVTVERNMQCGNALCGHCQMGGIVVCRDGPVVPYPRVAHALSVPEC
jgi:NAD(P)H-flavin reductase